MQQDSTILFIDLPDHAENFRSTLLSMGMDVKSISLAQATTVMKLESPRALLTPEKNAFEVAKILRGIKTLGDIPFFALGSEDVSTHNQSAMPREVTALVPQNVEPGMLCLRLQTILQQSRIPQPRHSTLGGIGSGSENNQEEVAQAVAAMKPALKPEPLPDVAAQPEPEQVEKIEAKIEPGLTRSAVVSSPDKTAQTANKPASTSSDEVDLQSTSPANSKARLVRVLSIVGVAAAVVGGIILVSGDKSGSPAAQSDTETTRAAHDQKKGALEATSKQGARKPAAGKLAEGELPAAEPNDDTKNSDEDEGEKESGDDETDFFKISSSVELEACEKVLDKPKEHYEKMVNWRGAQAWKQSRRSLMSGKQELAHQKMCEAALIDPKGPATTGLARYYLDNRSLKEAQRWAKRGIEVHPNSSRAATELLGDVLSQMGKMDEARELWLKTLKLTIDDQKRLVAVARTLSKSAGKARRAGDSPRAERLLRRAVAFDEKNADVAAALASVLLKNKEDRLADLWAKRALSLDANSKVAKYVVRELKK